MKQPMIQRVNTSAVAASPRKGHHLAIVVGLVLVLLSSVLATGPARGAQPDRVAGLTRFETAVAVSRRGFPSGAATVYLAGGDRFADALAAGSLTDGPVLLVPSCGDVPDTVSAEIDRLELTEVVALGGEIAVCDDVLESAAGEAEQVRLAGLSRYETSAAISARGWTDGAGTVYLASGADSPDAVAGGALVDGPILLLPGEGTDPDVQDEIERLEPTRVVALGGTAVIGDIQLLESARGLPTGRIAGDSRFETAAAIAEAAFPASSEPQTAYLARADVFADAVAAGTLTDGPILLIPACDGVPESVAVYLQTAAPRTVFALGGEGAICDAALIEAATGQAPDPNAPPMPDPTRPTDGSLYYTSSGTLTRYDFDTAFTTTLFEELGATYTMPTDTSEFVWYDNNLNDTATVTIHDASNSAATDQFVLPYELRATPQVAPSGEFVGGLRYATTDAGDNLARRDLVFFDRSGSSLSRFTNIKAFAFAADGSLILSRETGDGTFGISIVTGNFTNPGDTVQSRRVREFPNYDSLPTHLSVSADSTDVTYAHLGHIWTLALNGSEDQRQMSTSGLSETEPTFSPDGTLIALNLRDGDGTGCGTVVVIENHTRSTPTRLLAGGGDDQSSDFPFRPVDDARDELIVCGAGIFWGYSDSSTDTRTQGGAAP